MTIKRLVVVAFVANLKCQIVNHVEIWSSQIHLCVAYKAQNAKEAYARATHSLDNIAPKGSKTAMPARILNNIFWFLCFFFSRPLHLLCLRHYVYLFKRNRTTETKWRKEKNFSARVTRISDDIFVECVCVHRKSLYGTPSVHYITCFDNIFTCSFLFCSSFLFLLSS